MTETRCDRCNVLITSGKVELTLVDDGHVETLVEDLCPRCVTALRDFCRPLAVAAEEKA